MKTLFANQPGSHRCAHNKPAAFPVWLLATLLVALCAGCVLHSTSGPMSLAPPPPLPPTVFPSSVTTTVPTQATAHRINGSVRVHWANPDPEVWMAEWSTNMVNWTCCTSQGAYLPPREVRQAQAACLNCVYFTDTPSDWAGQWFVRLRRK